MFSRFTLALRLLCIHFPLIAALVLTVWLPGNAVVNYLVYCTNASESTVFRVPIWIETLFSPIYTGGVIYALARISDGYRPRYGEALGVGLHLWIPLFGARLVAGLFIILGLIAFVVPGILLAVRFLLIDYVVVLERSGIHAARSRSAHLTKGKRMELFAVCVILYALFGVVSFALYVPFEHFPALDRLPVAVLIDCVVDLVFVYVTVVLYLYYRDATRAQVAAPSGPEEFDTVEPEAV